jgi:hypothetical protein
MRTPFSPSLSTFIIFYLLLINHLIQFPLSIFMCNLLSVSLFKTLDLFCPEDGGNIFFRNFSKYLPDYTASLRGNQQSTSARQRFVCARALMSRVITGIPLNSGSAVLTRQLAVSYL